MDKSEKKLSSQREEIKAGVKTIYKTIGYSFLDYPENKSRTKQTYEIGGNLKIKAKL